MNYFSEQTNTTKIMNCEGNCEVALSPTIDMSEIYLKLGTNPAFNSKCPTLRCSINLPGDYDYITIVFNNSPILVSTRKGLSNEDVLKIVSGSTKDYVGIEQPWPVGLPCPYENDVSTFYLVGARLAKAMHIRCPHIFVNNNSTGDGNGMKGNAFNTPGVYAKTTLIEIYENPGCSRIALLETLAHEMRHCWQHEKYPRKYFSNYKYYTDFKDKRQKEYYLQPAELDARAYALRFIRSATGVNHSLDLNFPKVNQKIEKYAKTLDDSLFKPFEGLLVS